MDTDSKPGRLEVVTAQEPARRLLVLKRSTHEDNCNILTDIRDTLRSQITMLKAKAHREEFTVQEATKLEKFARVFQALSNETDKEHAKYDFRDISTDALEKLLGEGKPGT